MRNFFSRVGRWIADVFRAVFFDHYGLNIFGFMTVCLGLFMAFMVLIGVGVYHVSSNSCDRVGDRLNREVVYDFWGEGCFVETDDGLFIPTDQFRVTNEENER